MTSPRLLASTAKFGFNLLRSELSKQGNKDQNVIVSPLSASLALGMTASGARGLTLKGMNLALGLPDGGADNNGANNNSYANLLAALKEQDLGVSLKLANALWVRQGVNFEESFLVGAVDRFQAEVRHANFGVSDLSLKAINKWVKDNTEGKIEKILENIGPDAVMYLLNALYFKGTWQTKFDKSLTKDEIFYAAAGEKKHPFMYRSGKMRYANRGDYEIVALPFGETKERVHLYVLLPVADKSVSDVVEKLDGDRFFNQGILLPCKGELWLPRFKLEYNANLNESLQGLGMKEAFSGSADFRGMKENAKLCISNVIQKVVCSFDEEGGELAAATAVEFSLTSAMMPWQMRVDRPFIAVLADEDTGAVIGAGAVVNP
ncbi:MAG: serpin family protein [Candidatus Obscuribacterales bacterium]|nr:serpin family protein [Candidatus Obscuribacterales bacterium]